MSWLDPQGERVIKLNNGFRSELSLHKTRDYEIIFVCGDIGISKQGEKLKVDEKENT